MIRQLSIYTENRKGAMRNLLSRLSGEHINILGFVSTDSGEFGTIRLIVSDTDRAVELLEASGYLCRTAMVVGVELPDEPGALEELMATLEYMNINIDYLYVGFIRESNIPVVMLHCEEMDLVYSALKAKGYILH